MNRNLRRLIGLSGASACLALLAFSGGCSRPSPQGEPERPAAAGGGPQEATISKEGAPQQPINANQ
jgi:hypothetical protein